MLISREEPVKSPWFSLNHISHLATVEIRVVRLGSFQNLYLSFAIVEITWCYRKPRRYRFPPCKASNLMLISSANYFLSYVHPKRKHPWLSINVRVHLGKRPYAWEQNRATFWSLVCPKCSKLEVYNPRVMILEICSIIYKSYDPQIFHLQNKLWLYILFMRLGACLGTI